MNTASAIRYRKQEESRKKAWNNRKKELAAMGKRPTKIVSVAEFQKLLKKNK
jgi:hypothetical protein